MVINSVPLRQLACPYIQEGFCVPLRKTSPIYTGKILRALRKIPPIYTGGILRTPTQNLSYIHRKDFVYSLIARNDGFWRSPETDFRNETEARCSIQESCHNETPDVELREKLTGSLYWWVEQCVPTLHREYYRTL